MKKYYTYMLRCCDGSLYTGYTDDIEKRLKKHNEGKASKYTRSRLPVTLAYLEEFEDKSSAMSREARIKLLSKKDKEALITSKTCPL